MTNLTLEGCVELAKERGILIDMTDESKTDDERELYCLPADFLAYSQALVSAETAKLHQQGVLYQADFERIWSLMPELRHTDSHYEIHEAVDEKLAKLREEISGLQAAMKQKDEALRAGRLGLNACIDRYPKLNTDAIREVYAILENALFLTSPADALEALRAGDKAEIAEHIKTVKTITDVMLSMESRIEQLSASNARMSNLVKLYKFAYTPDGHSAPHDCFASGPSTGNRITDYVSCPGCAAEAEYSAILSNPDPSEWLSAHDAEVRRKALEEAATWFEREGVPEMSTEDDDIAARELRRMASE